MRVSFEMSFQVKKSESGTPALVARAPGVSPGKALIALIPFILVRSAAADFALASIEVPP